MGLFGSNSTPFDEEVVAATDGHKEDWQRIMNICDRAKISSQNAKDCLTSILSRMRDPDPHIVLSAITLIDACVNNCGKNFHLHVASRDFENDFRKILHKSKGEVRAKLLSTLRSWAEGDFSKDTQLSLIPSLCKALRQEGVSFPNEGQKKVEKTSSVSKDDTEDADLAKAIELSLKLARETTSPKSKGTSSTSSSLYPSVSSSLYQTSPVPEGRKVRALYDFEACEAGELTFKAGELITIIDETDQNWWKGSNQRGEGLFPSNFVTSDLSLEPEQSKVESKRTVQFNEEVRVKKIVKEEVEIDEMKMNQLLHQLHEADPTDPSRDPPEMRDLIDEVNAMGPLIDAELERVDSKAAALNQLCLDLQGALNLYHSLMKETAQQSNLPGPSFLPKPMGYPYSSQPQQQINGASMMGHPPSIYQLPGSSSLPPHIPPQHSFIPDNTTTQPNGMASYGPIAGAPQQPAMYPMSGSMVQQQPPYQDKPNTLL